MKIKPVITDKYQSKYLNVDLDLDLDTNLILISGDSGIGKSFVWQIFDNDKGLDINLETFNYKDIYDINYKIKNCRNKLIVIDNADILLDEEIRKYIAFDTNNQYIIFGRNPEYLYLTKRNCKELIVNNNVIQIEAMFVI